MAKFTRCLLVIVIGLVSVASAACSVEQGPGIGARIVCGDAQEVEAGAGLTCGQLITCARAHRWPSDPPAISESRIFRHAAPPSGVINTTDAWIVVFELVGGGAERVDVAMPRECLP